MSTADKMKTTRATLGLNQIEMAGILAICPTKVSQIERGIGQGLSLDAANRLHDLARIEPPIEPSPKELIARLGSYNAFKSLISLI
ncbi:MAG: hypothetical protein CML13_16020 [Puniceicoccaceae bacterium]|nr:hypothetical protein [Puniceicoccaceae bacterium]|tara:strand:+ start:8516 stop:8773 length:258 start_codon:yes stop_codon:yes gene_type:complete